MIELPSDMNVDTVEVIVIAERRASVKSVKCRRPPMELRGTIISDDLIAPAVPESEWNALQ
jgi:hypothetical protein